VRRISSSPGSGRALAGLLVGACLALAGPALGQTPAGAPRAGGDTGAGTGRLESVVAQAEGRLLSVQLRASIPLVKYSLARQGPPEQRDLVVRLPGFTGDAPTHIDVGDYLLPVQIAADPEADSGGIKVVFGGVGDSLVRIAQDGPQLSIVIIPPATRTDTANAYHVGPNDTLQIDVFGHEDLNKTLKVSPSGLISFPLIGNVRAEGRTVDEVAADITERLAKDYIQDPHVTVAVWEYLSQWVNVIGEVAQPGRYYMTGPTTLIDAIAQAGGLGGKAGAEILVSRRPEEVDPASAGEVFHINIKDLFSSEGGRLNMRLRSGDIVNVLAGQAAPGQGRQQG
jgi:protein involved in polysaccharide export with SLBB domain